MRKLLSIFIVLLFLFSPMLESVQAIQIYDSIKDIKYIYQLPYVINEPGTYVLNLVKVDPSNQTIVINADNVTIDGKGLFIPRPPIPPPAPPGSSGSCGIIVRNKNNVIIRNVKISDCTIGIVAVNVNNLKIENVYVSNIYSTGIKLRKVTNAILSRVTITSSNRGLSISNSNDIEIEYSQIMLNKVPSSGSFSEPLGDGITISDSYNILIKYTDITDNVDGLLITGSDNIIIRDSLITNEYTDFTIIDSNNVITYYSQIKIRYVSSGKNHIWVYNSTNVVFFLNVIEENIKAKIEKSKKTAFHTINLVEYVYNGVKYLKHLGNYYPEWAEDRKNGGGGGAPPPNPPPIITYNHTIYDSIYNGESGQINLFGDADDGVFDYYVFDNGKGIYDPYPLADNPENYILIGIPIPPQNLRVVNKGDYVYLAWDPPGKNIIVNRYYIFRKEKPDKVFKLLDSTSNTYYNDRKNVLGPHYYYYYVIAEIKFTKFDKSSIKTTPSNIAGSFTGNFIVKDVALKYIGYFIENIPIKNTLKMIVKWDYSTPLEVSVSLSGSIESSTIKTIYDWRVSLTRDNNDQYLWYTSFYMNNTKICEDRSDGIYCLVIGFPYIDEPEITITTAFRVVSEEGKVYIIRRVVHEILNITWLKSPWYEINSKLGNIGFIVEGKNAWNNFYELIVRVPSSPSVDIDISLRDMQGTDKIVGPYKLFTLQLLKQNICTIFYSRNGSLKVFFYDGKEKREEISYSYVERSEFIEKYFMDPYEFMILLFDGLDLIFEHTYDLLSGNYKDKRPAPYIYIQYKAVTEPLVNHETGYIDFQVNVTYNFKIYDPRFIDSHKDIAKKAGYFSIYILLEFLADKVTYVASYLSIMGVIIKVIEGIDIELHIHGDSTTSFILAPIDNEVYSIYYEEYLQGRYSIPYPLGIKEIHGKFSLSFDLVVKYDILGALYEKASSEISISSLAPTLIGKRSGIFVVEFSRLEPYVKRAYFDQQIMLSINGFGGASSKVARGHMYIEWSPSSNTYSYSSMDSIHLNSIYKSHRIIIDNATTTLIYTPRYYLNSLYDKIVWNMDDNEGYVIANIYPYTRINCIYSIDDIVLVYTFDNTSLEKPYSIGAKLILYNRTTNSWDELTFIPTDRELVLQPTLSVLDDHRVLIGWFAIPYESINLSSTFFIENYSLKIGIYNIKSREWENIYAINGLNIVDYKIIGYSGIPYIILEKVIGENEYSLELIEVSTTNTLWRIKLDDLMVIDYLNMESKVLIGRFLNNTILIVMFNHGVHITTLDLPKAVIVFSVQGIGSTKFSVLYGTIINDTLEYTLNIYGIQEDSIVLLTETTIPDVIATYKVFSIKNELGEKYYILYYTVSGGLYLYRIDREGLVFVKHWLITNITYFNALYSNNNLDIILLLQTGGNVTYPLKALYFITTKLLPTKPLERKTIVTEKYVYISWKPPLNPGISEVKYYIVIRDLEIIAYLPVEQTWFNDTLVDLGTPHIYQILAVNNAGESEPLVIITRGYTRLYFIDPIIKAYRNEQIAIRVKLISINGTPLPNYNILFYIYNGSHWVLLGKNTTNNDGYAVFIVKYNGVSTTKFKAVFNGTSLYTSSTNEITIEWIKKPVVLSIDLLVNKIIVNNSITFTVKLSSIDGKPLSNTTLYLYNGTRLLGATITDWNGIGVFNLFLDKPGIYNLTIKYSGSEYYDEAVNYTLLIVQHRVELYFILTNYKILDNGTVLFIFKALLLIDGKPFPNQTIFFYKKGSWIFIGSNTTDPSGTATLYYLDDNIQDYYIFRINYTSTNILIPSTYDLIELKLTINNISYTLNNTYNVVDENNNEKNNTEQLIDIEKVPPLPEPPIYLLILFITLLLAYLRSKNRNK